MPAKKKIAAPEHVTLSKDAVHKLLSTHAEPMGPMMMSPWDILQMERSEYAAKTAELQFRVKKAEDLARKFATELSGIKAEQELQAVTIEFQSRANAHDKVAATMAARYNFSWATHSYNPETGEVLDSSPES